MQLARITTATLLVSSLVACGPKEAPKAPAMATPVWAPTAEATGEIDSDFIGTWTSGGLTSSWSFTSQGEAVLVAGIDNSDGEVFEVRGLVGEGKTLRFMSRMPSTDHIVEQTWTLTGGDTASFVLTGDGEATLEATKAP